MTTLAQYRIGRVALHVICILRGGDRAMHLAGVMRELRADRCRCAGVVPPPNPDRLATIR